MSNRIIGAELTEIRKRPVRLLGYLLYTAVGRSVSDIDSARLRCA